MRCRNDYFKNSLIPYLVREWNRLSTEIRSSTSCQEFRKSLLSFVKPACSSLFSIHCPIGVKLLVRLRLGFSHLCEHKFSYYFHHTVNETALANILLYGDSKKSTRFNELMNHSSKGYTYMNALYQIYIYIYIYIHSILKTCYICICAVQMRSTTPKLNYYKCLSIK